MTEPDSSDPRLDTPADLAAALDRLPPVRARAEFEAELRRRFVDAPVPIAAPPPVRSIAPIEAPPRRSRWLQVVTIAAAAGIAMLLWRWPYAPNWSVLGGSQFEHVTVDGKSFTFEQQEELAEALHDGVEIETGEGQLDLRLDQRLAVHLGPQTTLVLLRVPEPAMGAEIMLEAKSGHVAVVTGPEFAGAGLVVRSPDADARVVGTEFAVDIIPAGMWAGTCVCCAAGQVRVLPVGTELAPAPVDPTEEPDDMPADDVSAVGAGRNNFVHRDRFKPVEAGEADADHLAPLQQLRGAWED
jgi:ferric-dicitrate binding protein FerR (iron transport regulator)